MSATDDAIRRSVAVGGTDAADIERQLVKGGSAERGVKRALGDPHALERHPGTAPAGHRPRKMSPAGLAKLARKSAARNAPEPDMGTGTVADRHR